MKKLISLFALALGMLPIASSAALSDGSVLTTTKFSAPVIFSTLTPSQCLTLDANDNVTTAGAACASGSSPYIYNLTGLSPSLNATTTYTGNNETLPVPVGLVINHVYVSCDMYNTVEVAAHRSNYSTVLTTSNTFGGGTFNLAVVNTTYNQTAPNVLASMVFPTTTYPGPYTSNVVYTLGTPYTVGSSDNISYSTVASADTQYAKFCTVQVGP